MADDAFVFLLPLASRQLVLELAEDPCPAPPAADLYAFDRLAVAGGANSATSCPACRARE